MDHATAEHVAPAAEQVTPVVSVAPVVQDAQETQNTQPPAADPATPPGQSELFPTDACGCHAGTPWRTWERGCLIEGLAREGRQMADIAGFLGRTVAAVRREYLRLLSDESPCPPGYVGLLSMLRSTYSRWQSAPACRAEAYVRSHGATPNPQEPAREQAARVQAALNADRIDAAAATALENRVARLEAMLPEINAIGRLRLAACVAAGQLPPVLVERTLARRSADGVLALAKDIRQGGTDTVGPAGPGETALDEERWQDTLLTSIGVPASVCRVLAEANPPIETVEDWLTAMNRRPVTVGLGAWTIESLLSVGLAVQAFLGGKAR